MEPLPGRNFYHPFNTSAPTAYSPSLFGMHVRTIWPELTAIIGGVAVVGIKNWQWGNSGFHFESEGWFGKNTGSGGMDKLGHAYSSALLVDFFTDRLRQRADNPQHAAISASLLSFGIMTAVEVFDGYAIDHGFAWEDMAANTAGIAFAYLRNTIPGMRTLVDFRQEYIPLKYDTSFRPLLAYENKRFLLAFKLSGIDALQDTPLRYLEVHAGYFARGFSSAARNADVRKRREPYIGIGINLGKLFFGRYEANESLLKWSGRFLLEHQQIPFTSFGTGNSYYERSR